jgi:hypothetical protein
MEVQTVGTPINQAFFSGTVPIVVGVLNPANSPQSVWDCGTAYEYASITTVVAGTPTSFTILLEGSLDGLAWTTLATASNTAGETQFSTGVTPFANLRARCTAVSGGSSPTVSIAVVAYQNPPQTIPGGATPGGGAVSGTVTANQGTPAAKANAWPVGIVDANSNGPVQVVGSARSSSLLALTGFPSSILAGTATANAATIITIGPNLGFVGQIQVSGTELAAAAATVGVSVQGAGSSPASGTTLCQVTLNATATAPDSNSATIQVYVLAPAAGCTLRLDSTATNASASVVGYTL